MKIYVKPFSDHPAALEATAMTIESLHMGRHRVARDEGGEIELVHGWMEVESSGPDFLEWAIPRQGYAEAVSYERPEEEP